MKCRRFAARREKRFVGHFFTGYTKAEEGLKKASYRCMEMVPTIMTEEGTLDDVFASNIEG